MKKGDKIGQRTVVSDAYRQGHNTVHDMKCKCGKITAVRTYNLKKGIGVDLCQRCKVSTHKMTKTPEYESWYSMMMRCQNKNSSNFSNYGGRGIKVIKRWHKFENFYTDMGKRPKGKTLDRINNNKNYSKSNCKWSTPTEQSNNQRTNVRITYKGKTMNGRQWDRKYGLKLDTVTARYKKGIRGKKLFIGRK